MHFIVNPSDFNRESKNCGVVEVRSCQKTSSDWFSDRFKWMGLSCFYAIESESYRGEEELFNASVLGLRLSIK